MAKLSDFVRFTDIGPGALTYQDWPINYVLSTSDDAKEWPNWIPASSDKREFGEREVIAEATDGTLWRFKLRLWKHQGSDITIATKTTTANSVTYTPTQEGRMVTYGASSALLPTASHPCLNNTVAGALLTHYTSEPVGLQSTDGLLEDDSKTNWKTTLTAGDICWVVYEGDWEVDFSGAVTDNEPFVSSSTVAGEVEASPALNVGGTITQYNSTLVERTYSGREDAAALGVARETLGGAGLARVNLLLTFNNHIDTP